MRQSCLLITLLSAGVSLSAQQFLPSTPAKSAACPIGFSAQVNGRAIARSVEDQKKKGDGPFLKLTFGRREAPKLMSASITVHGSSSSDRYLPVDKRFEENKTDKNKTQTFDLDSGHGAAELANSEVRLNKILFVSWVEVTDLRYADGSTWHVSSDAQCRAVPSKLHLVDAAATPGE
jgi:hypothetical protein